MSFSYGGGSNPTIDYPRMLIGDTNSSQPIFQDSEILSAYQIQAAMFQSSMFFSGPAGQNLPSQPVSYLRVAALLLDSLSSNKAYLASIKALPDVKLDSSDAAKELRTMAAEYRSVEDNAGAFVIIEQCTTIWGFQQRYWNQIQRQTGIGGSG